jgi:hypothetical protein
MFILEQVAKWSLARLLYSCLFCLCGDASLLRFLWVYLLPRFHPLIVILPSSLSPLP